MGMAASIGILALTALSLVAFGSILRTSRERTKLRMTDADGIAVRLRAQIAADDDSDLGKFALHRSVGVVFSSGHIGVGAERTESRSELVH
jgi:hypothetical protein